VTTLCLHPPLKISFRRGEAWRSPGSFRRRFLGWRTLCGPDPGLAISDGVATVIARLAGVDFVPIASWSGEKDWQQLGWFLTCGVVGGSWLPAAAACGCPTWRESRTDWPAQFS